MQHLQVGGVLGDDAVFGTDVDLFMNTWEVGLAVTAEFPPSKEAPREDLRKNNDNKQNQTKQKEKQKTTTTKEKRFTKQKILIHLSF